jgi:hypothetical protein
VSRYPGTLWQRLWRSPWTLLVLTLGMLAQLRHPLSGETLYVNPRGWRQCRECERLRHGGGPERLRAPRHKRVFRARTDVEV